jgi:arylsulfatase
MENKSSGRIWPMALIAVAAIGVYLYSSVEVEPSASAGRPTGTVEDLEALATRDDTNIVFVLVDTLRSERMSAYGYERETTPFLTELAETGIRFDHHIAQSSWTKSSMASIWTSLNPIRSGVTKFNHAISADATLPAEILKEHGFKTVGLYRNGWVHGYFGFDQGFDKYYRPMGAQVNPAVQRMRPNAQAFGADEHLMGDAIEFLRIQGKSSRWFLYLHLMDLHEYTYDEESALFGNTVPDLYDNSVRRTDWVLSTLYDYLRQSDLLKDTIFVVLSDHGEAFGERGFEGHARAGYPETTETPWIISLPFSLPSGVVVETRTTNVDVWPTLLDLMGLPDGREMDGRSRRPEILAVARGQEGGSRGATDDGTDDADDLAVAFLDENWGRPGSERKPAISVLEGDYRYVAGTDHAGKAFEVLLSTEDGQVADQKLSHPEILERLREQAAVELEKVELYETQTFEIDELQLDQLRALGYDIP